MRPVRELIEVMEAFERGEKIQFKGVSDPEDYWKDTNVPLWNWNNCVYRIKPKPTRLDALNEAYEKITDVKNKFNVNECVGTECSAKCPLKQDLCTIENLKNFWLTPYDS